MKTLLILSIVSMFPILILGIVLPITWLMDNPAQINTSFVWGCIIVLSLALTIVITTILRMFQYVSKINNLDKAEEECNNEFTELRKIRNQYEALIIQKTS